MQSCRDLWFGGCTIPKFEHFVYFVSEVKGYIKGVSLRLASYHWATLFNERLLVSAAPDFLEQTLLA